MIHFLRRSITHVFDKHPLISNCITYGTFTTSAEFLQQSLTLYDKSKIKEIDRENEVSTLTKIALIIKKMYNFVMKYDFSVIYTILKYWSLIGI